MTLRTIENTFSEILLTQTSDEFPIDLTLDGPIMTKLHPKLIWTKLQLHSNPHFIPEKIEIPAWKHACFATFEEAKKSYPQIEPTFVGKPWTIFQFLQSNKEQAIVDFGPLGTIVLSKQELQNQTGIGLHHHLLPIWANYALSPELWGSQGKWTRFHARLHKLFSEHQLIYTEPKLGHYPLIEKASILENHGFIGTRLEKSYLLVLPWTFSLAALEKLEEIIRQEF
jgi:hypothetical protein